MKGLSSWNSVQRAKQLFEMFPAEIAEFITYETEVAQKIVQDKEKLKASLSEGQVFPAAYWVSLAETAATRIKQHEIKMAQSPTVFSEQLFDGDNGFFSKHCLLQFSLTPRIKSSKFKVAVELLFQ
jgi:hypothetical protein